MYENDLSMSEVLHDPMIRLMLRADRVPLGEFARIMENAAIAKNQGISRSVIRPYMEQRVQTKVCRSPAPDASS